MVQTNILGDLVRNKAQVLMQLRQEKEREKLEKQRVLQQAMSQIGGIIQQKQKADQLEKQRKDEMDWKTTERDRKWKYEDEDRVNTAELDKDKRVRETMEYESGLKEKKWGDLEKVAREDGLPPPSWVHDVDPNRGKILDDLAASRRRERAFDMRLKVAGLEGKMEGNKGAKLGNILKEYEAGNVGKREPDTRPLHEVQETWEQGLERQVRVAKLQQDIANNDLLDLDRLKSAQNFEKEIIKLESKYAQMDPRKALGDAQRLATGLESILTEKKSPSIGVSESMFKPGDPLYDMVSRLIQSVGDLTQIQIDRVRAGGR